MKSSSCKNKKLWCAGLLTVLYIAGLLLTQAGSADRMAENIRTHVVKGKSGRIVYVPGTGHQIQSSNVSPGNWPVQGAVTYGLSGGRMGDNLISYLHARWIAWHNGVPLIRKPFPMDEEFAFSHEPEPAYDGPFVEIPYFPEPSMKNADSPFLVDWDDPGFRSEIVRCLQPTRKHRLLEWPSDRISVCVHVRRGGAFDSPAVRLEYPLKFPPDSFYIEQIRTIARIFQGRPLYLFIMTDDLHPEELARRYRQAVPDPNIQWDWRKEPPENDLDDFFSIPRFDCLILCDSNFSIVASKLGDYAIKIAPTHYARKKDQVRIIGLDIIWNAAKMSSL